MRLGARALQWRRRTSRVVRTQVLLWLDYGNPFQPEDAYTAYTSHDKEDPKPNTSRYKSEQEATPNTNEQTAEQSAGGIKP